MSGTASLLSDSNWAPEEEEEEDPHVRSYRVAIIGDAGVGKSSLFVRFERQLQIPKTYGAGIRHEQLSVGTTLGVDYREVRLALRLGKRTRHIQLRLTDTAGTERFQSITRSYLRGQDVLIYTFDVTRLETLRHLFTVWHPFVVEALGLDPSQMAHETARPVIILVGTKSDLLHHHHPHHTHESMQARSAYEDLVSDVLRGCCPSVTHDVQHVAFTSAVMGVGVRECFETLAKRLWEHDMAAQVDELSHGPAGISVSSSSSSTTTRSGTRAGTRTGAQIGTRIRTTTTTAATATTDASFCQGDSTCSGL